MSGRSEATEIDDAVARGFTMTELERRLRAPDGAQLLADLLIRLSGLSQDVATDMTRGLPVTNFARAEMIYKALGSARAILRMFPVAQR